MESHEAEIFRRSAATGGLTRDKTPAVFEALVDALRREHEVRRLLVEPRPTVAALSVSLTGIDSTIRPARPVTPRRE